MVQSATEHCSRRRPRLRGMRVVLTTAEAASTPLACLACLAVPLRFCRTAQTKSKMRMATTQHSTETLPTGLHASQQKATQTQTWISIPTPSPAPSSTTPSSSDQCHCNEQQHQTTVVLTALALGHRLHTLRVLPLLPPILRCCLRSQARRRCGLSLNRLSDCGTGSLWKVNTSQ